MKIKTYPLQFTEEYLKHIEKVAKKHNKTIKDFILESIKEKIEKWEKGEQDERISTRKIRIIDK